MNKNILNVGMLAALVMGGVNMAHAATSTTVTVKGSINTVTCDISSSRPEVDLGNYLPADFTTVGAFTTRTQEFKISLTGCAGTPGVAGQASLRVSGPVATAGDNYFSDVSTSPTAVGLALKATPTKLLSNGAVVDAGAAGATTAVLNGTVLDFTTGLISSVPAASVKTGQQITAPLKFDFVYN